MTIVGAAWLIVIVSSVLIGASLGAQFVGGMTGVLVGALLGIFLGALIIVLAGITLAFVFKGVLGGTVLPPRKSAPRNGDDE